ncbi:MAG: hypothetical protein ACKOPT_16995 [Cyanobium sp.]
MDDIANLAFIGGRSNRKIYTKPPSQYIPELIEANGTEPFESQCIPTDPSLLTPDRYPDFLSERRRRIASRLNTFLGSATSPA